MPPYFCTAPGPAPVPVGQVEVEGQTYAIEALANGNWRVPVDGAAVTCLHPDTRACYWSVRNYLQSRQLLDDLG